MHYLTFVYIEWFCSAVLLCTNHISIAKLLLAHDYVPVMLAIIGQCMYVGSCAYHVPSSEEYSA